MKTPKLASAIEWGLLLILAVMPLHAFFSVVIGHYFGHEALFQAWKEIALLVLAGLTGLLLYRDPVRLNRLQNPWILGAGLFVAFGLLITLITRPPFLIAAFGIKTDLEFLLAGLIAAMVTSADFLRRTLKVGLIMAAVVSGYDLLQIFILPPDFMTHFGYGPSTIAPYQQIAQGSSALRFPSTLGGPNQLGTYLILPLCVTAALLIKHRRTWQVALLLSCIISLIWTFSRSAWLGAAAALLITIVFTVPAKLRRPAITAAAIVVLCAALVLPALTAKGGQLQYLILHSSLKNHAQTNLSDSQHFQSLTNGAAAVISRPFGHGLGTAGPATFHAGNINIIENYYLQVGYETGLAGIGLFVFIVAALTYSVIKRRTQAPLAIPIAASLIGISMVALVLPAWTDSSTALIMWITAGGVAGLPRQGTA